MINRIISCNILSIVNEMVKFARTLVKDIEFSAEDATRSEPGFLVKLLSDAVRAPG